MTEKHFDLENILSGGQADTGDIDLDSLLDPKKEEPNPLENVEYTGKVEDDAVREADAVKSGFKERAAREQKRFEDATGTEFYAVICFQTEEQKEAVLDSMGIPRRGRKHFQKYIDARVFVKALNRLIEAGETVELPPADIHYSALKGDPKLGKLT